MKFLICAASWTERPVKMRLPFQFGSTEVRETAEAFCTVEIEVNGARFTGRSAQLMVPRWFNKRQDMSNADTIDELRRVLTTAVVKALGLAGNALEITRTLRADVASAHPYVPALAAGFGPSVVEMAVIDALCRAAELPFWKAAQQDLFGLSRAGSARLSGDQIATSLARISAPKSVTLRHTVGFDAPLWNTEVSDAAPRDGLPVSLEDVIAKTGTYAFKIKLKGAPEADHQRLRAIADLLAPLPRVESTLDANEQYTPENFQDFLRLLDDDDSLSEFRDTIRLIEQPFAREVALSTPVSCHYPLIIDESDDAEDAFERALALGWSGTSIKSCKGVLRALLNMALADSANAVLSGEDLTCQPGLCWQQDIAMMSACGVRDVERNGHHFAGGLQGASTSERAFFLNNHSDIYTGTPDQVALNVTGGGVNITSLDRVGFGCDTDALSTA